MLYSFTATVVNLHRPKSVKRRPPSNFDHTPGPHITGERVQAAQTPRPASQIRNNTLTSQKHWKLQLLGTAPALAAANRSAQRIQARLSLAGSSRRRRTVTHLVAFCQVSPRRCQWELVAAQAAEGIARHGLVQEMIAVAGGRAVIWIVVMFVRVATAQRGCWSFGLFISRHSVLKLIH